VWKREHNLSGTPCQKAQRPHEEVEGKRETGMGQKDDSDKKEIAIYLS
jgi:hypothetical protein